MKNRGWVGLAVCAVVALTAACGQIRTVEQGEPPAAAEAPDVHIDPCAIVEREEMAAALGQRLDVERLQIWKDWYYCEWLGGDTTAVVTHRPGAWAEVEVERNLTTVAEQQAKERGTSEDVSGLGAYARWIPFGGAGELQVTTPGGALVYLRWDVPAPAVTPVFRARVIELARIAVARVDPLLPGVAGSLPAPSTPLIHPCRAITDTEMRRVLGFTGGAAQRDYVGGPFGGHWYCERITKQGGGLDILGISVMKDQSKPADVPKLGQPVAELGPEAGASFAPAVSDGAKIHEPAALAFLGPQGRIVVLTYGLEGRDDAWHRQTLVELARVFGKP